MGIPFVETINNDSRIDLCGDTFLVLTKQGTHFRDAYH